MKCTLMASVTTTALFAVVAIPAQIIAQENPAQDHQEHKRENFRHYRVKDLGMLGGTFSMAFGLNSKAHVGGGASLPAGNQHAFLWTKHEGMRTSAHSAGQTDCERTQ